MYAVSSVDGHHKLGQQFNLTSRTMQSSGSEQVSAADPGHSCFALPRIQQTQLCLSGSGTATTILIENNALHCSLDRCCRNCK